MGLLQEKHHQLGGLNSTHVFLRVLEAAKSKIKVLVDLVCSANPLPDLQMDVTFVHFSCENKLPQTGWLLYIETYWDFLGSPVVKSLPCSARDVGSIPGWNYMLNGTTKNKQKKPQKTKKPEFLVKKKRSLVFFRATFMLS